MIFLKAIDKSNWEECIGLAIKPEQDGLVKSNLYSLAEAQFMDGFKTRAIYKDAVMVGFVMFGRHPYDDNYWIYRFMIDGQHQGKHYSVPAVKLVLKEIMEAPDRTDDVMLCYKPDNKAAASVYAKAGFIEDGTAPWGDILARFPLKLEAGI
jgi:diamine N-acetyltransferase